MDPIVKFVPVNCVPTKIVIWDDDLKQSDLENVSKIKFNYKRLILMITGNPGEIDYYRQYMAELHSKTRLPVIGVSNAGHNRIPESLSKPDLNKQPHLFGLEAQIVHKAKFIQEFIDPNTRLIIPTHSIGSYITLELLDRYPEINQMVDHSVMLFPTIHSLIKTKIGVRMNFFFQYCYYPLIFLVVCLETFLSQETRIKLTRKCLQSSGYPNVPEHVVQSATNMIDSYCLKATILMVLDEFRMVDLPKISLLKSNADKLSLFYGENDHWAPIEYYHYLKEKVSKHSIPLDLRLNLGKMDHAFVMDPENIPMVSRPTLDVIQKKWNF